MTEFKNPAPICPVCGKSRSAVRHDDCSKQLQKNGIKRKPNHLADYLSKDPVDYWESRSPWDPTEEETRGDYDHDIYRQRELDDDRY